MPEWLRRNVGRGSALLNSLTADLRRSSSRSEWLLEQSGTGVVELDRAGTIRSLNASAERHLGVERERALGQPIGSVLPGLELEPGISDRVVHHTDGSSSALEVTVSPLRSATMIALRDVSDRRRADVAARQSEDRGRALLALHESEARFRSAVETMQDSFGIFTALRGSDGEIADFTCTYVNPPAARGWGWPQRDLTGDRLSSIWPGGERQALAVYRRVVEAREPAQMDTVDRDPETGGRRVFDVRAVPFGDGFAATWRDITGRIKMENDLAAANRELKRSNEALEEFARVVSHDLTEPLWTVSLFAQALEAHAAASDGHHLSLQLMDAIELMQERVHDLLVHAQVRGESLQRELIDTRQAATDAVNALTASIQGTSATVEIAPLPSVVGDRVHLRQLFQNLVSNAVKYCPPERTPHVKIFATAENSHWHFQVEDNGAGIPEQDRDRIFGVFQRGGDSEQAGSGIGLAVCRKVVELHGGKIWATPHDGPGTTFHFTLPSAP